MSNKWRGTWWTPDDPELVLGGTLNAEDGGGIRLELVGGFDLQIRTPLPGGQGYSFDGTWKRLPIVHGICETTKITLIDCQMRRQTGGFGQPNIQIQDLGAAVALTGVHLESVDDPIFRAAQIRLENLAAWAGLGGVEHEFNEDGSEATARITRPPAQEVDTTEGNLRVSTRSNVFKFEELRDSVNVIGTVTTVITVTPNQTTTYSGFDKLSKALTDLLTLASGEACGVISEQLYYDADELFRKPGGTSETVSIPRTVDVLREPFYRGSAETPPQDARRFLFTCRDKPFSELVSQWLPFRSKAIDACNVLFGLRYAPPILTEIRLLTVAVTAEAMHRALYPDTIPMLPADFDRIRTRALRSLESEADRKWVESKLRNEPSYRERMLDLANKPATEAVDFIIPDREAWAKNLGNARNGLAHAARGVKTLSMFELEKVTEQLLHLVLMTELGLSAEVQLRAVQSNGYMTMLARKRRNSEEA